jgi:hypothetical protein
VQHAEVGCGAALQFPELHPCGYDHGGESESADDRQVAIVMMSSSAEALDRLSTIYPEVPGMRQVL